MTVDIAAQLILAQVFVVVIVVVQFLKSDWLTKIK